MGGLALGQGAQHDGGQIEGDLPAGHSVHHQNIQQPVVGSGVDTGIEAAAIEAAVAGTDQRVLSGRNKIRMTLVFFEKEKFT